MPRKLLPALFALFTLTLAACVAGHSANDASDDTVQILPDHGSDGDYLVMILNRQNFIFNGDLPADRHDVASSRLKAIGCREPRLLREKAEPRDGTWAFGRKRIVYYSEWACG